MSEAKHTQGEWSVLEHDGEVFILANGAQQIAAVTYVIEHAGEQGSRRLQNARLMAAGPKLLEALQLLHDDIAEYARINNLGGFDNHCMRLARAAISKATGAA